MLQLNGRSFWKTLELTEHSNWKKYPELFLFVGFLSHEEKIRDGECYVEFEVISDVISTYHLQLSRSIE